MSFEGFRPAEVEMEAKKFADQQALAAEHTKKSNQSGENTLTRERDFIGTTQESTWKEFEAMKAMAKSKSAKVNTILVHVQEVIRKEPDGIQVLKSFKNFWIPQVSKTGSKF